MNCYCHEDRMAANTCSHCGNWICGECMVNANGRILCKNCVAELASKNAMGPGAGPQSYPHPHAAPTGYEIPRDHRTYRPRNINAFFLFCLSGIPGLNYMYMGLMKRGLFVMSSFFISIYLMSYHISFMPFITFVILCTSFFDAFSIRRKMLAGIHVADDIDSILNFVSQNKSTLLILGILFLGLQFIDGIRYRVMDSARVMSNVFGFRVVDAFSNLVGLGIIVLGIYIFYKAMRKNSSDKNPSDRNSGN